MKAKRIFKSLIAVVSLAAAIIAMVSGAGVSYAATSNYSDALTDLQIDTQFNEKEYPANDKDYSIKLIQIAESADGELFVYTYQPCQKTKYLIATDVNMSLSETADGTRLYDLTLLNTSGVFCKYKVEGVTVSTATARYYNITSIFRDWIDGIDKATDNDNTSNSVSFAVGKCFKATTDNGKVKYEATEKEVITVTDKFVGFQRYTEGYWLWRDACDSHYIAFSTDWEIDYLYEAEVYYVSRSTEHLHVDAFVTKDDYRYGDEKENTVFLSEFDTGHTTVTGIGGVKHTWSRIQSVTEFKNTEKLSDEALKQIKNKQWVLRFADTDYTRYVNDTIMGIVGYTEYYTEISEVTILRLKFLKSGKVYNLGVVDNKQTGSDKPTNEDKPNKKNFWQYIWNCITKLFAGQASIIETIVAVVAIVVALIVVGLTYKFITWFIGCFRK